MFTGGCEKTRGCITLFYFYNPKDSKEKSDNRLVMSRIRIDITLEEKESLEIILKDGIKRNLSIEAINRDDIFLVSSRTVRRYVFNNVFDTIKQGDLLDAIKY